MAGDYPKMSISQGSQYGLSRTTPWGILREELFLKVFPIKRELKSLRFNYEKENLRVEVFQETATKFIQLDPFDYKKDHQTF